MKIKIRYEETTFHTAEVEVDEDSLLEYINSQLPAGDQYSSLDEARKDEGEDLADWLREYVQEEVPVRDWKSIADAGEPEREIDFGEEIQ